MKASKPKKAASWSDVKARLTHFDCDGLVGLLHDLYAAGGVSTTYSWCKDQGFHLADALAFGRVAGREAAARV